MRKRTIARVLAVVLGAALALGALAGCQSPATGATDQQQANRTYMTKVNQAVEDFPKAPSDHRRKADSWSCRIAPQSIYLWY